LQEEPISVIARGESGSGKSTLIKRVALLFPPAVKIEAMKMTEAAWFNTGKDHFKHKIFIAGERTHATDANARDAGALLRQLLSEGRINRGVSIWDKDAGEWHTEWMEREGPIAYADSTTAASIFEEDLNRLIQVYADDSQRQNENVVLAIARKRMPGAKRVDTKAIIDRHHKFQKYLQTLPVCQVIVPYAEVLVGMLPMKKTKVRRAAQQLFSLLDAIVLLDRHNRDEKDGCLVANFADYALGRELLLAPMHAALGVQGDYKKARALRAELGRKAMFTTPEVKAAMGFKNDMQTSRFLKALVEAEVVERIRGKQGQTPALYQWGEKAGGMDAMVLPTARRLQKAWEAEEAKGER
jgi:hypothetical protein